MTEICTPAKRNVWELVAVRETSLCGRTVCHAPSLHVRPALNKASQGAVNLISSLAPNPYRRSPQVVHIHKARALSCATRMGSFQLSSASSFSRIQTSRLTGARCRKVQLISIYRASLTQGQSHTCLSVVTPVGGRLFAHGSAKIVVCGPSTMNRFR